LSEPVKNTDKTVRHAIRNVLVLAAVVITLPLWLPVRFLACFSEKDEVFLTCSQILSLFPGLLGIFLRRGFYLMCTDAFSWDCTIAFGTWLSHPHVKIGRCVYIGARCTVGNCEIGDYALIGSNVDILTGRYQHRFDDPSKPISEQGGDYLPVRIGRNTWIGNSAVIMADVGDDSIIGAGSVIVKPIAPGAVAVGNPCVVKRMRLPVDPRGNSVG
jgi:virginiamycin A acetyltransferase